MKRRRVKKDQIFPPYLVPCEDAMYQDHFDLNYIREEIWEDTKRLRMAQLDPTADKYIPAIPVNPTPTTEDVHRITKGTNIIVDIIEIDKEKVDEQSFYAVDDDWFDDW